MIYLIHHQQQYHLKGRHIYRTSQYFLISDETSSSAAVPKLLSHYVSIKFVYSTPFLFFSLRLLHLSTRFLCLFTKELNFLEFLSGQTSSGPHFCMTFLAVVNTVCYLDSTHILRYLTSSDPQFCVIFFAVVNTTCYSASNNPSFQFQPTKIILAYLMAQN